MRRGRPIGRNRGGTREQRRKLDTEGRALLRRALLWKGLGGYFGSGR
jgi:hypothetical protein